MNSITIVGAGWLGRPLAHQLEALGHSVSVTKTTQAGIQQLTDEHLTPFLLNLTTESAEQIAQKLQAVSTKIVIGCFPPGFRRGNGEEYSTWWSNLVIACQIAQVERIVMVSSTTVYPNIAQDMPEKAASWDLAINNPTFSANAQVMLRAEQAVVESGLSYGIVRCSGLVGPDRHPSRFVSKLKQISDLAPANMLHLTDAIGAVIFVSLLDSDTVVNATTPNTTNKARFYQAALNSVDDNSPLPLIVHNADKRILPDRLLQLGYRFHFGHTLEFL